MSLSTWNSDKKELFKGFYENLDLQAITSGVMKIQDFRSQGLDFLPPKWSFWASGRHFDVYKWDGRMMDFAIKLSSHLLFSQEDHHKFINFRKKMKALKQVSGYLIPPFEVLEENSTIILIQPLAQQPISAVKTAYKPFDQTQQVLRDSLQSSGFIVDDVLQFRCWNHIPLLIDFSDITYASL